MSDTPQSAAERIAPTVTDRAKSWLAHSQQRSVTHRLIEDLSAEVTALRAAHDANLNGRKLAEDNQIRWMRRAEAAEAKNQRLEAALRSLVADWRERARAVRPLETSPISSEKRERTKEWMFYTNRASEAEALLADPPSETGAK